MATYELAFLKALLLTVIFEMTAAAALKLLGGRRLSLKWINYLRFLIMVALASMITLPYVWFVLPAFVPRGLPYILTAEISVTVIEALWYFFILRLIADIHQKKALTLLTALILSIVANGFSYFIGNVIL